MLTQNFNVFYVGNEIDRRRIVIAQFRSARATLLKHDASVFLTKFIGDTFHRADLFAGATAENERVRAVAPNDRVVQIKTVPRNFSVGPCCLRRRRCLRQLRCRGCKQQRSSREWCGDWTVRPSRSQAQLQAPLTYGGNSLKKGPH